MSERPTVDMILVYKGERVMHLMQGNKVVRTFQVALGPQPQGHKQREGDGRTPEGGYLIDWRNPNSSFHLSLHISYPRHQDRRSAMEAGLDPGGAIMIHGL
ncbi:MAG: L,D-transpeptidase family protein, partial [Inquilinus sp.]|nr:L,D-transpeptidase family protein [Inquilinus sp.]